MKPSVIWLALLVALPAAADVERRTWLTDGPRTLREWTDGVRFGFEECAGERCQPVGTPRPLGDRAEIAAGLTADLRDHRERLIYGDDTARAAIWFWPGFASGAGAVVAAGHARRISPRTPRLLFHAALFGFITGGAAITGVYARRPHRDVGAAAHLLSTAPLLADGLPLEAHWEEPRARALIWYTVLQSLRRVTALPPASSR